MNTLSQPGAASGGASVAGFDAAAARPRLVIALSVLAVAGVLLAGILLRNGGNFAYTLDAPYTQMALGEQILRGTYGLNPGEPASPSSSILYPFLVAALAWLPLGQFVPLIICLVATVAAAMLIYSVAEEAGIEVERLSSPQLALLTVAATLAFNLVGLAFAGLEHSLHVTLTVISLLGLMRFVHRKQADWWWLLAIGILPLLRFEAAAALAADMLVLAAFGKWRHAIVAGLIGVVLIGGFMAFLVSLGLPPLPSSVLSRSEVASVGVGVEQGGVLAILRAVYAAFRQNLMAYGGAHIMAFVALGLWGLARGPLPSRFGERRFVKPAAVGFFVVVALAQLLGGSLSSFSRYEIYVLVLGACVALIAWQPEVNAWLRRVDGRRVLALSAALLFLFCGYLFRTVDAVSATGNVNDQQRQMARFVGEYWQRPFAANHPGWVNWRTNAYMLDLSGLGSEEARRELARPATREAWLEGALARHDIGLAMLYDNAGPLPPASWQSVAKLRLRARAVTVVGPVVTFYATRPGEAERIRAALEAMAPTLPAGAILQLTPP